MFLARSRLNWSIMVMIILALAVLTSSSAHSSDMFLPSASPIASSAADEVYFQWRGSFDDSSGIAHNLERVDDVLYVADDENGALLLDISNADNIELLSNFTDYGYVQNVHDIDVLNRDKMVVFTQIGNIYQIDTSTPTNPRQGTGTSWYEGNTPPNNIKTPHIVDQDVFVIEKDFDGYYWLYSYDFSVSNSMDYTRYGMINGTPTGLAVQDGYAYVTNDTTIQVFDISSNNLQDYTYLSGLSIEKDLEYFGSLIVEGNLGVTINNDASHSISLINVTIPETASILGSRDVNSQITKVEIVDGSLYILTQSDLLIYNVSDLSNIYLQSSLSLDTVYHDVLPFDNYIALSSDSGVQLLSVVGDPVPQISSPTDQFHEAEEIEVRLSWDVSDNDPKDYNITLNGDLYSHESQWYNGSIGAIVTLTPGIYDFAATVYDHHGNSNSDHIRVEIVPPPAENSASDDPDIAISLPFNSSYVIIALICIPLIRQIRQVKQNK